MEKYKISNECNEYEISISDEELVIGPETYRRSHVITSLMIVAKNYIYMITGVKPEKKTKNSFKIFKKLTKNERDGLDSHLQNMLSVIEK